MPAIRKRKNEPSHARYIYKILKMLHPDMGISSAAILSANAIVEDLSERLIAKSGTIARCGNKSTMASRHVQGATKLLLPPELAKHAVSEGTSAVFKFTSK